MLVGQLHLASLCLKSILCFSVFQSCVRFDFKKIPTNCKMKLLFFPVPRFVFFYQSQSAGRKQTSIFPFGPIKMPRTKEWEHPYPSKGPGLDFLISKLDMLEFFHVGFPFWRTLPIPALEPPGHFLRRDPNLWYALSADRCVSGQSGARCQISQKTRKQNFCIVGICAAYIGNI